MNSEPKTVTVIGAAIVDVLAGPVSAGVFQTGSQPAEQIKLSFGGDALNEAAVLRKLGIRPDLISKVGMDEAGENIRSFLRKNDIPDAHVICEEGLQTGINIVLIDETGERCFLTNPQSSLRRLALEDVLPLTETMGDIVSFASIFVSPLLTIPAMKELFAAVKRSPGRILTADMTKAKHGERLQDLAPVLPYIDYIFPNESEIALLTGIDDPCRNARLLTELGAGCAVVKTGADGCVICRGEELLKIPAYQPVQAVDTTGAGDCFAAGFLYGLAHDLPLAQCGAMGCATASCTVEHYGAGAGIVSDEEPRRRAEKILRARVC